MLLGFEVNFKRRLRRVNKRLFNELGFTEREGKPMVAGDGLTALELVPRANESVEFESGGESRRQSREPELPQILRLSNSLL